MRKRAKCKIGHGKNEGKGEFGSPQNESLGLKCGTLIMLGLLENFQKTCFGHVFSKACQYATSDEKVCKGLKYVLIKSTYENVQKCITWPKKSSKGWQEWNKVYIETNLKPKN